MDPQVVFRRSGVRTWFPVPIHVGCTQRGLERPVAAGERAWSKSSRRERRPAPAKGFWLRPTSCRHAHASAFAILDRYGRGLIQSSGIGRRRQMKAFGVFLAVLAAIAVAVFIFAPDRLPSGIGLLPVPIKVSTRSSLIGEGQVATISNPTGKTLRNVRLVCRNTAVNQKKEYFEETWPPGKSIEIGWLEGWRFEPGETLTISASGYAFTTWNW